MTEAPHRDGPRHGVTNAIVRAFLHSNLSIVLILLSSLAGAAALLVTPREEDPQIVVPMADVYVDFPGRSAQEVEQLVATPLEQILFHIDGVEYVYSMSREDQAIITVRFYVGEDRERSLVKLYKKIDENLDRVPPGVTGWVVKPVEIDDVPIVTLTLTDDAGSAPVLRRVAEETVARLAAVENVSRAYVVGGEPRVISVWLDPPRLRAHNLAPLEVRRALAAANVTRRAGELDRDDAALVVEVGDAFADAMALRELVVGVFDDRPVFLKDVARIEDRPQEASSYVRCGWGPARGYADDPHAPGAVLGPPALPEGGPAAPAVTIAVAKKKGTNAVWVAREVLRECERLLPVVVPAGVQIVVTRNFGLTADEKVNELVEALGVAIVIVVAILTLGLGWREALIVCVAVPVVFGLTLFVNLLAGFSINRVTLFALILSLGLLVDDPIVDVENVARHFRLHGRATRAIVLEAIAEIRPPLIVATLAVIVSFLPMFFITGMMGPYMRPMALNVPVAMLMSMVVAFTITPWLCYHVLRRRYAGAAGTDQAAPVDPHDFAVDPRGLLRRLFHPLMSPLLRSRRGAATFLGVVGLLTLAALLLAAVRGVPLKMLPFGNKDQLQLVLNFDEGTTLERTDAAVRDFEAYLATVPEVTCFTSYVGTASPMDFNGMVRHYYLRTGRNVADIVVNLAPKKSRARQTHSMALAIRDDLTALAARHGAALRIVEMPPGPPTIAPVVAEVYGRPDHAYEDLVAAARTVRARLAREPGVVDLDDSVEAVQRKLAFVVDKEKAAVNGTTVRDIAETVAMAVGGDLAGVAHAPRERNTLGIMLQLPRPDRSTPLRLTELHVKGNEGQLVPLAELGRWEDRSVDPTIYHKNLRPVVYVFADTAGRPQTDAVVDVMADRVRDRPAEAGVPDATGPGGWVEDTTARPVRGRTFFANGSGVRWSVPAGIDVDFAGEGEWQMTLDVFRDLGIAFAVALVGIYVLLVAQMRSFAIPVIVMLAIPLTFLGIMPGFWLLNRIVGGTAGQYADPVYFTATAMIGMIALAGIVTRQSVILIDFIHLSLGRGRALSEAVMESCVVRMRPILLTAGTAMLSAIPIAVDPVFSGLAWALIFGLIASTVFALFVVPLSYWLVYEKRPGHGLPPAPAET